MNASPKGALCWAVVSAMCVASQSLAACALLCVSTSPRAPLGAAFTGFGNTALLLVVCACSTASSSSRWATKLSEDLGCQDRVSAFWCLPPGRCYTLKLYSCSTSVKHSYCPVSPSKLMK